MFTGFGSALNIETLVAAAERRETPIEVLALSCFKTCFKSQFVFASPWLGMYFGHFLACL